MAATVDDIFPNIFEQGQVTQTRLLSVPRSVLPYLRTQLPILHSEEYDASKYTKWDIRIEKIGGSCHAYSRQDGDNHQNQ